MDEAVNYNKEIYAELICDRIGAHVVPYMQRLVRRVKGDDRIILISDQFVDDGPVPPGFEEATDINFYVGRAVNPAHQNPDLPINFNIKMNLVEELSECLRRMGKRIKVSYF